MSVELARLLDVMKRLRDPETGCEWDLAQTFQSIASYTIEEAYELEEAIQQNDISAIRDELGDLLLQVVFQAQIAEDNNQFDFEAVAKSIADKMERRHPHIFGNAPAPELTADGVKANWEQIKQQERDQKGQSGLLDDVAVALPGMLRAVKLQKRAAKVGFDWNDPRKVIEKIREELAELEQELDVGEPARLTDELGDVLFSVANLARHLKINPETAIKSTNQKFINRFQYIERHAGSIEGLERMSLVDLETLWVEAKND
jgi:MazG family protein